MPIIIIISRIILRNIKIFILIKRLKDETRFYIGYDKTYWVITFDFNKLVFWANSNNQEYIILVQSISAKEKTIPPMLILFGIFILEKC